MPPTTGSILDLRVGERALAGLMAGYNFVLLLTLYLLKPARDSLFLVELGPERLPLVFLAVAAATVPVTLLYGRLGRRLRLSRLVNGTTLALVASLAGLRWAVGLEGAPWATFLLYVWVSVYSVLATSQFWLLAGAVFDPAQAKRVFALLSLGAILGAIVGGEATALLVGRWGLATADLLWIAAGLLAATVGLVGVIRARADAAAVPRDEEPEAAGSPWGALAASRHLRLIAAVIGVAVLTTTLVDFQFKTAAEAAFPAEAGLTGFMGRFYGRVSLVALLLQLVLVPRVIRVRGIGGALLLLPLALALGSVLVWVAPLLLATTLLRGADQSLKHSLDRTGRELLFLPVPLAQKKQAKVFVDVFVDQGMQGVAGLVLLGAVALGLGVEELGAVVLALALAWAGLAVWARRSYVQTFREALPRKAEAPPPAGEAAAPDLAELREALTSGRKGRVLEALDGLAEAGAGVPAQEAGRLVRHRSARVRRRALRLLAERRAPGFGALATEALRDRDAGVRLEAARYLYREAADGPAFVRARLASPDVAIRAAVVGVVAEEGDERARALLTDGLVRDLLRAEGPAAVDARAAAAKALGALNRPRDYEMLRGLLDDPAPAVVHAAIHAAARTGSRRFIGKLIRLLGEHEHADAAREALITYGERVFGTLYDHLTDDTDPEPIRRNIPRILAHLPVQPAVDLLLLSLARLRAPLLYDVAKALNKLRAQNPDLRFGMEALDAAVLGEIRALATLQAALYHHARADDDDEHATAPGADRVRAALWKERAQTLERVHRLLGLRYPTADMHSAYLGLTEDPDLRAAAAEFLDSVLDWEFKRHLVPLLDDEPDIGDVRVAEALAGRPLRTWQDALRDLLLVRHPRPLACALADLPEALPADLAALAHAACTPDPSDDPPEMRDEPPPAYRPAYRRRPRPFRNRYR